MSFKYALLIGINYTGTPDSLLGCINDVETVRNYLVSKCGYLNSHIMVMTDETEIKPTARNIMHQLSLLILKAHSKMAQELYFSYSGHGTLVSDRNGDEVSGQDQCIVPLDYAEVGVITDDSINDYLSHLPKKCRLRCIMDCCHSGSILDLAYSYGSAQEVASNRWLNGDIICISGCRDDQTSADVGGFRPHGALTGALIPLLFEKDDWKCKELVERLSVSMAGFKQRPVISATDRMDDMTSLSF